MMTRGKDIMMRKKQKMMIIEERERDTQDTAARDSCDRKMLSLYPSSEKNALLVSP
jgi:hypothetical protein